jgi:hypothetical protein
MAGKYQSINWGICEVRSLLLPYSNGLNISYLCVSLSWILGNNIKKGHCPLHVCCEMGIGLKEEEKEAIRLDE